MRRCPAMGLVFLAVLSFNAKTYALDESPEAAESGIAANAIRADGSLGAGGMENDFQRAAGLIRDCGTLSGAQAAETIALMPPGPLRRKVAISVIEIRHGSRGMSFIGQKNIADAALRDDPDIPPTWGGMFLRCIQDGAIPAYFDSLREKIWNAEPTGKEFDSKPLVLSRLRVVSRDLENNVIPRFPVLSRDELDGTPDLGDEKDKEPHNAMPYDKDADGDLVRRAISLVKSSPDEFQARGVNYSGEQVARKMAAKDLLPNISKENKDDPISRLIDICWTGTKFSGLLRGGHKAYYHVDEKGNKTELFSWIMRTLPMTEQEIEYVRERGYKNLVRGKKAAKPGGDAPPEKPAP